MVESLKGIINKLQDTYDTTGPLYLSNFFNDGGEKWLYTQLQNLHQPVFKDNFKLLVVQDHEDIYEYTNLPGKAISCLQKYLSEIDIPNFFVLVITNNKNIKEELTKVKNLYSTDSNTMMFEIIKDDTFLIKSNNTSLQDTFCPLPWMHLYIGPDSNVLPCCVADQKNPMGSILKDSVDDILKSQNFNQLRHNMLSGIRSKECSRCYLQEDSGIKSSRKSHNNKWPREVLNIKSNGTIDEFNPKYIDIRLNNICNLKCRMCSGYFSSAIAQEDSKLHGNQTYLESSLTTKERATALSDILSYLPYTEEIYFAGGEPLLTPEHYVILDELIKNNHRDLHLRYNTNFTVLSYKDSSVLNLWKNFSKVTVGASLDAIGKIAEYVRHGTKWATIESNLELLKLHCPHVDLCITSTVGFLNVVSLIELQKTWQENKLLDISKFSMSILVGPDYLTVQVPPIEYKNQLDYRIRAHINWCQENRAGNLATQWLNVLNYMWEADSSHLLSKFKKISDLKDQYRNENFSNLYPELSQLITNY